MSVLGIFWNKQINFLPIRYIQLMHRNKPCYPYKRNNSVGVLHLLGLVYKQMGDLENDSPFPCHPLPSGVNNLPMTTPDLTERYLHHATAETMSSSESRTDEGCPQECRQSSSGSPGEDDGPDSDKECTCGVETARKKGLAPESRGIQWASCLQEDCQDPNCGVHADGRGHCGFFASFSTCNPNAEIYVFFDARESPYTPASWLEA